MEQSERTRDLLITHYRKYPRLQIQDILKYLHQSAFGCEHLVSELNLAIERIVKEREDGCTDTEDLIDRLDGGYSRIHLLFLNHGLSAETLGKLFLKSAKMESDATLDLETKLNVAKELVRENIFPFSLNEYETAIAEWKANGYPAMHHSDAFRLNYKPAYRVIANRYVPFLPLFAKIDKMLEKDSVLLAIDGGSASGKTTLSETLKGIYDCTVLHMDDFFLRPEQRTPERFAEVGGNVDRERFLEEVLIPLHKNMPINYRRFDCSKQVLCPPITILPKKLTIIEGAYSMHPELANYYDLSVFLDISPQLQIKRIEKRNTQQIAKCFFDKWIPLEKIYFSQMKVKQRCDLSVSICE